MTQERFAEMLDISVDFLSLIDSRISPTVLVSTAFQAGQANHQAARVQEAVATELRNSTLRAKGEKKAPLDGPRGTGDRSQVERGLDAVVSRQPSFFESILALLVTFYKLVRNCIAKRSAGTLGYNVCP